MPKNLFSKKVFAFFVVIKNQSNKTTVDELQSHAKL